MASDTQPIFPNEMFIHNVALFVLAYYVAKRISKVLDKPFAWEAIQDLRLDLDIAYDRDLMTERMRSYMKSYWFQSRAILLFMVLSVMQTLLLAHSLTYKCRWSPIALKLAEHYKNVDPDSRPNIAPYFGYLEVMGIFGYIILVNGGVGLVLYKLQTIFRRQPTFDVLVKTNFSMIPFIVLWGGSTLRVLLNITFPDGVFIKLFKE